jgi:hypothetical protein
MAGAAGRFVVAMTARDSARLARVTQGKRFITLWIRSLTRIQHAA